MPDVAPLHHRSAALLPLMLAAVLCGPAALNPARADPVSPGPDRAEAAAAAPVTDPARLVAALESLAAKGSARAQFELAVRYEAGKAVGVDLHRAFALLCQAALTGHAEAAAHLAGLYRTGRGTAVDRRRADAWQAAASRLDQPASGNAALPAALAADCRATVEPPAATAAATPLPPQQIARLVDRLAPRYGLDPKLVLAVMATESGFQTNALSPRQAQGLMQLIPETADRFGVKNPFDPEQNITGGIKYLRWLLGYFQGDVVRVLAAYNAGEGAVDRYRGVPPFDETIIYVARVRRLYPARFHPFAAPLRRAEVAQLP